MALLFQNNCKWILPLAKQTYECIIIMDYIVFSYNLNFLKCHFKMYCENCWN